MAPMPLLLSAFANPTDQIQLAFLKKEQNNLQKIFNRLSYLRYICLANASREDLVDSLANFQYALQVFHFGGHAKDEQLLFNDAEGHAVGLAQLLRIHFNLKLVFLNACATQHAALMFVQAKIPAVVATTFPINDEDAQRFAEVFYTRLAEGSTLVDAFNAASAEQHLKKGGSSENEIVELRGLELDVELIKEMPWRLYAKKEMLQWKLSDLEPLAISGSNLLNQYELKTIRVQVMQFVQEMEFEKAISLLKDSRLITLFTGLNAKIEGVENHLSYYRSTSERLTNNSMQKVQQLKNIQQQFAAIDQLLDAPPGGQMPPENNHTSGTIIGDHNIKISAINNSHITINTGGASKKED